MKTELDIQLVKDFPNLYKDRQASIMHSCMGWGFDCGDGWEPLIRELSEKLEKEIVDFKKQNPVVPCRMCSCSREKHYKWGPCVTVHKFQTKYIYNNYNKGFFRIRLPIWLQKTVNKVLGFFFYELRTCHCTEYDANYPRASQVKEKYGTLRFYMSSANDKMYDMIEDAESKSAVTCEECGQPGELRGGGWLRTLCDVHAIRQDGSVWQKYKDIQEELP